MCRVNLSGRAIFQWVHTGHMGYTFFLTPRISKHIRLRKSVPRAASRTVLRDVSGFRKSFQMILYRVAAYTCHLCRISNGDAPAFAAQFENLHREFGKISQD